MFDGNMIPSWNIHHCSNTSKPHLIADEHSRLLGCYETNTYQNPDMDISAVHWQQQACVVVIWHLAPAEW